VALSYVRKRFKLCLAKFFHKLKRSFVIHGISDKKNLQDKVGFQVINILKTRLSVVEESKQEIVSYLKEGSVKNEEVKENESPVFQLEPKKLIPMEDEQSDTNTIHQELLK